jgi:hypothetical protein
VVGAVLGKRGRPPGDVAEEARRGVMQKYRIPRGTPPGMRE